MSQFDDDFNGSFGNTPGNDFGAGEHQHRHHDHFRTRRVGSSMVPRTRGGKIWVISIRCIVIVGVIYFFIRSFVLLHTH